MKKVSLLVLLCMIASLMLATLASCEDIHTHEDADGNEICDTCESILEHKNHNFGTAWAFDATNHYHVCDKCNAKEASAAHADANKDGACDVCAIIMDNEHVYDTAWSTDATNHWHAPLCGHEVEAKDKAAHTPDSLGVCTVCGYNVSAPDTSTIAKAIAIAKLTQSSVQTGKLTMINSLGSLYQSSMDYHFEYGDKYLHIVDPTNNADTYVGLNADNTVFHVTFQPEDSIAPIIVDSEATADYLAGPAIPLGNYIPDASTVYGAVTTLDFLYESFLLAESGVQSVENGVYTFSYTAKNDEDVELYECKVSFTLAPESYVLSSLNVVLDDYYALNFVQYVEPTNIYTIDRVVPVSYDILGEDGNAIAKTGDAYNTIQATIKQEVVLTFGNITPATGLIDILGVSEVVFKDSTTDAVVYTATSSYKNGIMELTFNRVGSYTANFSVGEKDYVIPFQVNYGVPESIEIAKTNEYSESFTDVTDTEVTMYPGTPVILVGKLASVCERNAYTVAIKDAPAGAAVAAYEGVIYDDGGDYDAYVFTATETGTYEVVFTSTVDTNVSASVVMNVVAPPTAEELAQGEYIWDGGMYQGSISVEFVPTNATSGVANVEYTPGFYGQAGTAVFDYTITDGEFEAAVRAGGLQSITGLYISDAYEMTIVYSGWEYALEKVPEGPSTQTSFSESDYEGGTYQITIAASSSASISFYYNNPGDAYSITVDWDNADVTAAITGSGAVVDGGSFGFDYDDKYNFQFTFTNNGATEITLVYTLAWAVVE